ncbi:MAG: hypothetical protein J6S85_04375 [Methanobrevibacter sp.]|nr:hypothetical protein [Methanobrevibacter sp.]MBO7712781.1 hypothetical protein [Methanobrevibacter sp.]
MEITVQVVPNQKTMNGLQRLPDRVMYSIARQTLDMAYTTIPKDKGRLRNSSMAGGVRGSNSNYYIGSYTGYASSVWKMENVNWTTPGTSGKWYAKTLQRHGATIMNNAINQGWRQSM